MIHFHLAPRTIRQFCSTLHKQKCSPLDGPRHLLPLEVLFGGNVGVKIDIWRLVLTVAPQFIFDGLHLNQNLHEILLLAGIELFQSLGDMSEQVIEL